MAREMFPEKFKDRPMVTHEDLEQHPDPFNERQATNEELAPAPDPSPMSRLFEAVRAVLKDAGVNLETGEYRTTASQSVRTKFLLDLQEAYKALKLDG